MRNALAIAAVICLALLIAAPAGAASQANIVVTTGVPLKLYGDTALKARDGLVLITSDTPLRLGASGLEVTQVRVTSTYSRLASGADVLGSRTFDSQRLDATGPSIRVLPSSDTYLALVARDVTATTRQPVPVEDAPSELWRDARAQIGVLLDDESFGPALPAVRLGQSDSPDEAPGYHDVRAGSYVTASDHAKVRLTWQEAMVADAVLEIGARRLVSERITTEAAGGTYVPGENGGRWTGPGTHLEETLDYYVLRQPGLAVEVSADRAQIVADDVFVVHAGYVGLPWAEGRIETEDGAHRLAGEQAILGGDLRLRPVSVDLSGAPRLILLGDGDLWFLRIGVDAPSFTQAEAVAVAGGAAAGLGLLALVVYYWPVLKFALSGAIFPLYARVPKEQTLDHKGRELLYDLIKGEPGVSTNQLAREVPFGWSTLTYHLRVLERNEAIVSVRDGRYKRFFDRASGRFSNGRKYILAVLKNDATLGIARFIRERPGSSQKEVAGNFQLSPSSVHWHVERLNEVGLVQKLREAHNVKYFPGDAWAQVTIEDLKSLESRPASVADAPSDAPTQPQASA